MSDYISVFLDSARGQYIPRDFANMIDPTQWRGIDSDDIAILQYGPDHEWYWDSWCSVLDNAETRDNGQTLAMSENGDLLLVDSEALEYDLNRFTGDREEYETSHPDAGDSYAHLPREESRIDMESRLAEFIKKHSIETREFDMEQILEMVLDNFRMESFHMFHSVPSDYFELGSYPIGEIEIQLPDEMADATPYASISPNAFISDNGEFAYVTSDYFWCAIIHWASLQELINDNSDT